MAGWSRIWADVKSILGQMLPMMVRIDATLTATLPHLATKAELQSAISGVESKVSEMRAELADKPGKTYIWMVLGVLIMAYAAGLAGLAVLK